MTRAPEGHPGYLLSLASETRRSFKVAQRLTERLTVTCDLLELKIDTPMTPATGTRTPIVVFFYTSFCF